MALQMEDRFPIIDIMEQTPAIPENCQWAMFLRNHDELTLEMVTDEERDYMYGQYAADPQMRINVGIRRRLAPLMENSRRRIELMNSLLFSMPGTPIVYYGDEIGMGDNVYLGDRDAVRTPMQWTSDRNGGFSRADPARLYLPPIMDPVYGFQAVNVEAQSRSPSSLLNWMKRLIAVRQMRRAFGRGSLRFLYPSNRRVLAYLRIFENETILCVVNLARSAQAVELDLSEYKGAVPIELLGRSEFPPIGELPYLLTLQGHSFFWFLLDPQATPSEPAWQAAGPEFITLVVPRGWQNLFDRHNRPQLEGEILPAFLAGQRWFAAKDQRVAATRITASSELGPPGEGALLTTVEAELGDGTRQSYFLPLAVSWEPEGSEARQALLPATLAHLRQFRRSGILFDATAQESLGLAFVEAIRQDRRMEAAGGELVFARTNAFDRIQQPPSLVARRLGAEQSNSSLLLEDYAVLKLYRRLQTGVHPELEMARYLTETVGFDGTPPLMGWVAMHGADGSEQAIAVLFAHVRNQGEAWTQTLGYLRRYLDEALLVPPTEAAATEETSAAGQPNRFYLTLAQQLGRRAAELHRALCPEAPSDPAFAPEPITPEDLAGWRDDLSARAQSLLAALEARISVLPEDARPLAEKLVASRVDLLDRIDELLPAEVSAMKTRFHGDLHLGQVLVVQNDFSIIDFEGEPLRPLAERRRKSSPLRDVAGMLRSFHYATVTVTRQMRELQPGNQTLIESCAERWRQNAVAAFMEGYLETMAGCPALPADPAEERALLEFFTLEKAIYEIRYELANRPSWVAIPLAGVLDLLAPESEEADGADD
jgi:maltose alpha-D-glucosyltransferase/alpha-amylase